MKPVLSLCTYPCAQIGSSLYPLIVEVHLQIQAEREKKPRLLLQNPNAGYCPAHGLDGG